LGNPGPNYKNTRHNVGFKVIELLSKQLNLKFKKKFFQPYLYCHKVYKGQRIVLVKPLTYMNRSGMIIPSLLKKYKLNISNLLIITDNMDLEPGRCKLKLKGSAASHNGLKSVSSCVKNNDYMRLYIGIGHPGNRADVLNHVIGHIEPSKKDTYYESYKNCAFAVIKILEGSIEQVMNELNRKKSRTKSF